MTGFGRLRGFAAPRRPAHSAPASSRSSILPTQQYTSDVPSGDNVGVNQVDQSRLDWQKAQAELQLALAELERRVAAGGGALELADARDTADRRKKLADDLLNRYITQLGKS